MGVGGRGREWAPEGKGGGTKRTKEGGGIGRASERVGRRPRLSRKRLARSHRAGKEGGGKEDVTSLFHFLLCRGHKVVLLLLRPANERGSHAPTKRKRKGGGH